MNIPAAVRAIGSPHRDAMEQAFGALRPEAGWVPPEVDFLFLCFTNRCGSNYLAHMLATTGAFNEAGEFFNAPTVLEHAASLRLRSLPAYFSALPQLVTHGGRIAAKAGVDQVVMLADAGILPALGTRAKYLLLERQDRLGQAISRVIASQTGRWTTAHASDVPDAALVYDRTAIDEELAKIARGNAAFYAFFAANGIVPVHTTYEAVLKDPAPVIDAVAASMGTGPLVAHPEAVRIGRQRNVVNDAWREAYEGKKLLF
jgi:LPS sulfotransferase NodH